MTQTMIQLEQVSFRRDNKVILQDIDWQVKKGENWTILGLNGSGKTTLLSLITGYLWSSDGVVSVLGNRFGTIDVRELRKKIGWVSSSFQEKIYGHHKTQDIIVSGKFASIGLYEEPEKADFAYAMQLMEQLGCAHVYDRHYYSCSQGEKQKLLIARALMCQPELLILDEPCTGLDVLSREYLLSSIEQISAEPNSPTLIYVTHHIDEITSAFQKILLLRQGKVYQSGDVSQLVSSEVLSDFFETQVEVIWNRERAVLQLMK